MGAYTNTELFDRHPGTEGLSPVLFGAASWAFFVLGVVALSVPSAGGLVPLLAAGVAAIFSAVAAVVLGLLFLLRSPNRVAGLVGLVLGLPMVLILAFLGYLISLLE